MLEDAVCPGEVSVAVSAGAEQRVVMKVHVANLMIGTRNVFERMDFVKGWCV